MQPRKVISGAACIYRYLLLALLAVSAFSIPSHAQATTAQCVSVAVPAGWVSIAYSTDSACGSGINNKRTIEDIATIPTYGVMVLACSDGLPVPPGWGISDGRTQNFNCGSSGNNQHTLINLNNAPQDARTLVCFNSAIPTGWVITDTPTDNTVCGQVGFGNQRSILNVNIEPFHQQETICSITPAIPPGWTVISTGTSTTMCVGRIGDTAAIETIQNQNNPPPPGDFSIWASPTSIRAVQGSNASLTVFIDRTQGFNGAVTLSASGLPSGASASFNPNGTTGNSSTMTVTANAGIPSGGFSVTITGVSGSLNHSTTISVTIGYPRIGYLDNSGNLYVKEGTVLAPWVLEYTGVTQFAINGSRIGVIDGSGTLLVKEGDLTAPWVTENYGITQFALNGSRIGTLDGSGTLNVKEGDLSGPWVTEYYGVTQFQLNGTRIGIIPNDGSNALLVKEGDLTSGWVDEYNGVTQFQLNGTRIGIILNDGSNALLVKENSLYDPWVTEYYGVTQFQLNGTRIGIIPNDGNNSLLVKEGDLTSGWVDEYDGVTQFRLDGTRIGIILSDGSNALLVKDNTLYDPWVTESTNVAQFALDNGNRVGLLRVGGNLLANEGGLSADLNFEASGVTQFAFTH
jgi:hypothetical protein